MDRSPDSDRRVLDLALALASPMFDPATIQRQAPDATAFDLYAAFVCIRDAIDARLRELEPAARAERISAAGGLN